MKHITVIGGGTGSFTVLTGLKKLKYHITAIVPSTDSGGSTGRLVDEFGYLPPGDIRQCLVAMADEEEQSLLRKLFSYRFDKGEEGLKGHNFGNLFLTALRGIYGNEIDAIEAAEKLFDIKGKVYRSAPEICDLVAEYDNGSKLIGEHNIDEPPFPHDGRLKITKLYTTPELHTYPQVLDAISNSDLIVVGPGDLYTSILANLVIKGIPEAIKNSKAKFVYIMNLVTRFGQTYDFKASDFLKELKKYIDRAADIVLINNTSLPEEILDRYKLENAYPVENDIIDYPNVITADLLADERIVKPNGDVLQRSLIRHDANKLAREIEYILKLDSI